MALPDSPFPAQSPGGKSFPDLPIAVGLGLFGLLATVGIFSPTDLGTAQTAQDFQHLPEILGHVPRNITNLAVPLLVFFSAWWPGHRVILLLRLDIKSSLARIALSLVLGLGALNLVAVILGLVGALYGPVLWSITGGLALFGLAELIRSYDRFRANGGKFRVHFDWRITTLGAITIVYAWIALLGGLTPEVQYDGRLYHLADALRYAQHHRVYNLVAADHIFQNGFANYQETFYALLIVMAGVGSAKAGAWCIGVLAWYCLVAFVTDVSRSPVAGLLAGLLFLATPIVTWEMTTESTDLAEVPYALTALWSIHRWLSSTRNDGWLLVAGALSGFMFGIKATGGEFAAVAFSLIAISAFRASRGSTPASVRWAVGRPVGLFVIAAIPTAAIWLALSFSYTGDPFFPAALTMFHTPFSFPGIIDSILAEQKLHGGGSPWYAIFAVPFFMTYEVDKYTDVIGSIYVCGLPIVLLALVKIRLHDRAFMGALAASVLGFCLLYLTAVPEARYITWALALAAGLIAVAVCDLAESPDRRALGRTALAVMLAAVVASNQFLTPMHRNSNYPGVQGVEFFDWSYLYEGAPEASVQLDYVPTIEYMNTHLPAESKVYDCANLMLFNSYSNVELFNGCGFGSPQADGQWTLADSDAYEQLRNHSIGYIAIPSNLQSTLTKSALASHVRLVDSEATPIFKETVMLYQVI